MKLQSYILALVLLFGVNALYAQKDTTKTKTTDIDITKGRIKLPFPKSKLPPPPPGKNVFAPFKVPVSLSLSKKNNLIKIPKPKSSSLKEEKEIQFVGQERYITRNKEFERKLNKNDKEIRPEYKVEQYLGDFRSNGKFVKIVCRDHEFVDGDRVRVYVNDMVIAENITLQAAYKKIEVTLVKGFNKIEFQALNQGSSGPNTAEFRVYNDQGELISANEWNLTTGVKATMIITKE